MGDKYKSSTNQFYYWTGGQIGPNSPPLMVNMVERVIKNFVRTGTDNPHWRVSVKAGQNASNPMSVSISTLNTVAPRCYKYYNIWGGGPFQPPTRVHDESVGLYDRMNLHQLILYHNKAYDIAAESRAISLLYRKIRSAHQQFVGGVFAGEFRKTVQQFAHTAVGLRKHVFDYLTKGKIIRRLGGRDAQKKLNGEYLGFVFGWQPLAGDLQDGAKAISRMVLNDNGPIRFRVAAGVQGEIPVDLGVQSNNAGGSFHILEYDRTDCRCYFYGAFKGTVYDEGILRTTDRFLGLSGFNLRSFIPTVWELVPYSFLIDYFVNVGELLEAASTDTASVAWVTQVLHQETEIMVKFDHISPYGFELDYLAPHPQDANFSGKSGFYERKFITISRNPTAVPFLLPRCKLLDISGKQFLNIGALLTR